MGFQTAISKASFVLFIVVVFSLGFMKPSIDARYANLTPTDLIFPVFFLVWVSAVAARAIRFEWRIEYWAFVVYFGAMLVSALASENPELSVRRLVGVFYLILLAIAMSSVPDTPSKLRASILAWLAGSAIPLVIAGLAIVAFYVAPGAWFLEHITYHQGASPIGGLPRVSSTFISASMFCGYLTVTLVLALIARHLGWIADRLAMLLVLSIAVATLFTVSIGLGGAFLAVGLWICKTARNETVRRPALAVGIVTAIVFLAIAPMSLSESSIANIKPSSRYLVWQEAWATFLRHPILGKGLGLDAAMLMFRNNDGSWSILIDAHNVFLNTAATCGIIGLAALIVLIVTVLKASFARGEGTRSRELSLGLGIAFLVTFVYQGLTSSFEEARHLWALMGFVLAAARVEKNVDEDGSTPT